MLTTKNTHDMFFRAMVITSEVIRLMNVDESLVHLLLQHSSMASVDEKNKIRDNHTSSFAQQTIEIEKTMHLLDDVFEH